MKIVKMIQISDIHLGGDYDGMYTPEKNFMDVIGQIDPSNYVVITGDIADKDHEANYKKVIGIMTEKFGDKWSVLPGNHDNLDIFYSTFPSERCKSFEYEGVKCSLVPTVYSALENKAIVLGNSVKKYIEPSSIVFTHYPVIDTVHRFMKKFALDPEFKREILHTMSALGCKTIFCGHFHSVNCGCYCEEMYDLTNLNPMGKTSIYQYICPAVQCQIDDMSEEFVCASTKPKYQQIDVQVSDDGTVNVGFVSVKEIEDGVEENG